jgi:hypothetical protein
MNVNEVPQDGLNYKERDQLRKLMYAVDKEGKYTGVPSVGWEAENTAMQQAWEDVDEQLKATEARVRAGELSPIAYFMQVSLMDVPLLASYMGKWQWTIRRHMKPGVFAKLSRTTLAAYARVFNITEEALTGFGKK